MFFFYFDFIKIITVINVLFVSCDADKFNNYDWLLKVLEKLFISEANYSLFTMHHIQDGAKEGEEKRNCHRFNKMKWVKI